MTLQEQIAKHDALDKEAGELWYEIQEKLIALITEDNGYIDGVYPARVFISKERSDLTAEEATIYWWSPSYGGVDGVKTVSLKNK